MKLLVRGTNWIGDSVMTIPALRALRSAFPDAEIVLMTRAVNEGLFQDADFIDRVLPVETPNSGIAQTVRLARRLRNERFDVGVVLPNSFASALPLRLAGIPRRFGYATDRRKLLLTDSFPVPDWKATRHEVFYYHCLAGAIEERLLGKGPSEQVDLYPRIDISPERREAARAFLIQHGLDLTRSIVAVGAGSTNSNAKRWPAERFVQTCERLQKTLGAKIVLLGSEGDRAVSEQIMSGLGEKPLDLTGRTSIAEVSAILSVVDLLIANDMGLAHVAPAVGTRSLVIFGPTDPATTRPLSQLADVIRHEVECSPCMLRECPIDHRCMTRIGVDYVCDVATQMLKLND
ncbi:MAG TPA: lipopolysaccharide heptosyltransferase II [Pyrinomonadaceae bacterium]